MAQDGFPKDEMRYDALAQEALRGVVKAALKRAAAPDGLPGAHHFYITFRTAAPACPCRRTCSPSTPRT